MRRVRVWLALAALALGAGAAWLRTPEPPARHTVARPLYKPPSGC
jgi:hypothetical protein